MDQIFNSISSWILTTAIDFNPYQNALLNVNDYNLNLTMEDLSSVLKEITDNQIEAYYQPDYPCLKIQQQTFGIITDS